MIYDLTVFIHAMTYMNVSVTIAMHW